MRTIIILSFLNLMCIAAYAQGKKLSTIFLPSPITAVAVDRPGDVYIINNQHKLTKYDKDGVAQATAQFNSRPAVFDPRDGARLFAFLPEENTVATLNPALTIVKTTVLDSAHAIHPFLVCSSGDYHLIILDSADWSLKKVDLRTGLVVIENQLPDSLSTKFATMREYQHFIFLLDENKGIHILNGLGKFLMTVPAMGLKGFNFLGEELYYLDGTNLVFFDLFTAQRRTQLLSLAADQVIITDDRLYAITGRQVQIFAYTP